MLPETVFEIDLGGQVTFVSRSAFAAFGYTPQDVEKGLIAKIVNVRWATWPKF
jgi:PAS domain-containing protein